MTKKPKYKQHINGWCAECIHGPQPNDNCRMCHILDVPEKGKIGQPSNWEEKGSP